MGGQTRDAVKELPLNSKAIPPNTTTPPQVPPLDRTPTGKVPHAVKAAGR